MRPWTRACGWGDQVEVRPVHERLEVRNQVDPPAERAPAPAVDADRTSRRPPRRVEVDFDRMSPACHTAHGATSRVPPHRGATTNFQPLTARFRRVSARSTALLDRTR